MARRRFATGYTVNPAPRRRVRRTPISSVRAIEGPTKAERRSTKHYSTVTRTTPKGRRVTGVTTYQGTPVSRTGTTPLKRAPQRAAKVQETLARVRKAYKSGSGSVPEIVPPQFRRVVAKHGKLLDEPARRQYGMSGAEYLAKLIEFESGWDKTAENPSSAFGFGQFIDSTAEDFRTRLGVETQDPSKPKQMIKGAAMHASGKYGYGALYAGYNPGYGSDPIPGVDGGRNVRVGKTPKKKDLKLLRKAGVPVKKKAPGADKPEKKPGPWAGAQKAVLSKVPEGVRAEGRGDKRTPAENSSVGGATNSDHLTTNLKSYAADLPADDATARHIAQKLGLSSHTGTNQIVKDGYQYTLIWQDEGHYDHVHFGAEWVGKGLPPGTTLGGPSGGGSGASYTSSAAISTYAQATGVSEQAAMKARQQDPEGFRKTVRQALARVREAYGESGSTELTRPSRRKGAPVI
jgi:hypothetical protein